MSEFTINWCKKMFQKRKRAKPVGEDNQEDKGNQEYGEVLHQDLGQDRGEEWDKDCGQDAVNNDKLHQAKDMLPMPECEEFKLFTYPAENTGSHTPRPDDFEALEILGKGAFGTVELVRENCGRDEGILYAMKTMDVADIVSRKDRLESYKTECFMHQMFSQSPFLVGLRYAFNTPSKAYLVLDYYPGRDMETLLRVCKKLTEDQARLYLSEIVLAVEHLHQMNIMHCDLKPANILIDSHGHLAVSDYGSCKRFPIHTEGQSKYSICGTGQYVAPEIIDHRDYSMEVDWWSVGIITYKMLTGDMPFASEGVAMLYRKILLYAPFIPPWFSVSAAEFVTELLVKDPKKRLGGDTGSVQEHPFFDGIDWGDVAKKAIKMPNLP